MKKQLLFTVIFGLLTGSIVNLYAPHGGGGGGFHGGGGHAGGFRSGGHAGGYRGGARSSSHAGHRSGSRGGRGGHGRNYANNKGWNHAHGYGWGWRNGGWGRGWAWGFWGWPFWWGLWWPWPFLFVGGVAAWAVANQTTDTIIVTSDDDDYAIGAGQSKLVPKSSSGSMHIKAHYNNTGGTYTTDNSYVVAGDKGGKLVMDSDPGTQGEQENE